MFEKTCDRSACPLPTLIGFHDVGLPVEYLSRLCNHALCKAQDWLPPECAAFPQRRFKAAEEESNDSWIESLKLARVFDITAGVVRHYLFKHAPQSFIRVDKVPARCLPCTYERKHRRRSHLFKLIRGLQSIGD